MSRLATLSVLVCYLLVVQLGTQVLAQDAKPDVPPLLKADPLPAAKPLGVPLGDPLPAPAAFDAPKFSTHFSADGKTVLTARRPPFIASKGVASEARLWDAATGKPLGPLLSFKSQGVSVLVALHDKSLVTVRRDGGTGKNPRSEMQSWDAATGKSIWGPVTMESTVLRVMVSPEGKTIMTFDGFARNTRLWDAAAGTAIGEPLVLATKGASAAFSPDGKTLVTGSNAEIRFWDVATAKPQGDPQPHEGAVMCFSQDGKTVLITTKGPKEHSFRVCNVATGKSLGEALRLPVPEPKEFKFADVPYRPAVAYSPDGRTVLAATGDNTAQLGDALTGKTRGEALRHGDLVYRAAFSPDGNVLLTASGSPAKASEVRLWDVATSNPFCSVPHKGYVTEAVFSPDRMVLLLAGPQDVRLWQVPKFSK